VSRNYHSIPVPDKKLIEAFDLDTEYQDIEDFKKAISD
jgi:hypothetical protein